MKKAAPLILSLSLVSTVHGEVIRSYNPSRHDRFSDFPSDLASNTAFHLAEEDWSGVGWSVADTRKHFTLVSPRHFVGARHFRPAVGSEVRFVNTAGVVKTYTVAARHDILNDETPATATDLFVGELVEVVAPEDLVSVVPVLNLGAEANYVGTEFVLSGRYSRAGSAIVGAFVTEGDTPASSIDGLNPTRFYTSTYSSLGSAGDDAHMEDGDSGGPSLVETGAGLTLLGTHSAVAEVSVVSATTYTSFDTFVPHYLDELDAVLATLGYHVKRALPSEPELTVSLAEDADPAFSSEGAGYLVTISNAEGAETAHNLSLELSCDGGAQFVSADGEDWVTTIATGGMSLQTLRGGLEAGETVTIAVSLTLPDEPTGPVTVSAEFGVDGSEDLLLSETTEVVQTYQSWALNLTDPSLGGDEDRDGFVNELEYALGRDGGVREDYGRLPLSISVGGDLEMEFTRRLYESELGARVVLKRSEDLLTWTNVEEDFFTTTAAGYGLEKVVATLRADERAFFQLSLEEEE